MNVVPLYLPAESRYASFDLLEAASQSHAKSAVGHAFACTGSKKKNGMCINTLSYRRGGKKHLNTVNVGQKRQKSTHKDLCHIDP
ncbi:hypothetical protein OnM2_063007 [Erysiphe neolycopersici]|uniref:Uncharacterized protein n=1 Tax=Erysiphe neolycopersici TaxID=212602 RepID=A0A420HNM8_9PEZI|nr:hypothetical protein OnM2_063007 [Erysiphe neolycopersici]